MLEFRETELFTRAVTALLSDDEYAELQGALIVDPEVGDLFERSAGRLVSRAEEGTVTTCP